MAGGAGSEDGFWEQLFGGADTGFSCHAHAVFFSYSPLRVRGQVKLKDTLAFLFDRDLEDVACSTSAGKGAGYDRVRLLRGLAWFAPLGEKKDGDR